MTNTTPRKFSMMPDLAPVFEIWTKQTELALYLNGQTVRMMMAPLALYRTMGMGYAPRRAAATGPTAEAQKTLPPAAPKAAETSKPKPKPASASRAQATPDSAPSKPAPAPAPKQAAEAPAPKPAAAKPAVPEATTPKAPASFASDADSVPPARTDAPKAEGKAPAANAPEPAPAKAEPVGRKPKGLSVPRNGKADDLTGIKGVGPKLQEALNAVGLWHLDQIASLTEAQVAWLDENIDGVRGRASREDWAAQAKALIAG